MRRAYRAFITIFIIKNKKKPKIITRLAYSNAIIKISYSARTCISIHRPLSVIIITTNTVRCAYRAFIAIIIIKIKNYQE